MNWKRVGLGFFSVATASIGTASYYLSQAVTSKVHSAESVLKYVLDAKLDLSGKTITSLLGDIPVNSTILEFSFSIREALATSVVSTLEDIPSSIGTDASHLLWVECALRWAFIMGIGGAVIYFCKKQQDLETKSKEQEQKIIELDGKKTDLEVLTDGHPASEIQDPLLPTGIELPRLTP